MSFHLHGTPTAFASAFGSECAPVAVAYRISVCVPVELVVVAEAHKSDEALVVALVEAFAVA